MPAQELLLVQMKASKRSQRLLTSREFRAAYDRGKRFNTPFYTAFILKTDSEEQRMGVTVTRKLGGSVLRNRCKRRIREVFRLRRKLALDDSGYDIVINAKASLVTADFVQLEKAFAQTLAKFRESL